MAWVDLGAVFMLGVLGTGHCVGMCGVFAVAVSAGAPRGSVVIIRQVSYQLGKATAYAFIGGILLVASRWIDGQAPVLRVQVVIGWVVGVLMIFTGVIYAMEWRGPDWLARWWNGSAACAAMAALWRSSSSFKSLLTGWINGFLPCGLSLMALLYLVGTQSAGTVVIGAYAFGLGTLPGLMGVALLGNRIGQSGRRWLRRISGVALIAFGVLTLVRGDPRVHDWMHRHLMPGDHSEHEHQH